ncbi:MAG: MopE-related protein [Myxococcota bacterium]|nr:MopE-related protein [Myxococcota bacterium]
MKTLVLALAITTTGALASGCSIIVDGAIQDMDAAVVNDSPCATFPEGTACSVDGIAEALVCNDGLCELSVCGDGVVDERTEDCDDENEVDGDGCDFDCALSCEDAEDCDDGDACNGTETCSDDSACEPGTAPADGTACDTGGVCREGTCVPAGCGNGALDTGEECDPGISLDGSCRSDCTWTCETDEECALMDTTVCDGVETCNVATHLCVPGTAPVCLDDDANACTIESCDPSLGCVVDTTTNDADGDGHYATACGGDDCDDMRANVYTGLGDACGDGLDNDCNGSVDDGTPRWYADCDGDGYATSATGSMASCTVPTGRPSSCASGSPGQWTSVAPGSATTDCSDVSASARPGQTSWFTTSFSGSTGASYDYNCNGSPERQYATRPRDPTPCTVSRIGCIGTIFWDEVLAPACGSTATRSFCVSRLGSCIRATAENTVACH